MLCPCCSQKPFTQCCQALIEGQKQAATPEELMRSRYTAYSLGQYACIMQTMKGPALAQTTLKQLQAQDKTKWVRLDVSTCETLTANKGKGCATLVIDLAPPWAKSTRLTRRYYCPCRPRHLLYVYFAHFEQALK